MSDSTQLLPEEQELRRKLSELEERRNLLADRELELATLRARLLAFEHVYMEKVGRLYVELDELEAQLASWRFNRLPDDSRTTEDMRVSREKAQASRVEYEHRKAALGPSGQAPEPPPELKSLYRKLARQYHPDIALDPQEKERRSIIMVQVNEAYTRGDLQALERLSAELAMAPEAVPGDDLGSELIRVIRKIAQIDRRLAAVHEEINSLTESDLGRLMEQSEKARQQGRDLLDMLAADLRRKIVERRKWLSL
jgi:hypothetical protein